MNKKFIVRLILLILFVGVYMIPLYLFKENLENQIKYIYIALQAVAISFPITKFINKKRKEGLKVSFLGFLFFGSVILVPLSIAFMLAIFNLMTALKIMTFIVFAICCLDFLHLFPTHI